MQTKSRMLMAASSLLYLGPLLAGLSGMGWSAVPVFIALFAFWLVVMRPSKWPRDLGKWTSDTAVAAGAQVAVNALIVIILFGIGRGVGGVAGFIPNIQPWLPVAFSFLATPLSRLAWDPALGEPIDHLTDEAPTPAEAAEKVAGQDAMVSRLLSLGPDADPVMVAGALDAAFKGDAANTRMAALEAALAHPDPATVALREAVVLWSTDPARRPEDAVSHAQARAFGVAMQSPGLMHTYVHRGLGLLQAQPALARSFPDAGRVAKAIDPVQPPDHQDAIRALAEALTAAAPTDRQKA